MNFKKRFEIFRKLMDRNKIDAYLETSETNIFYITGFRGSSYPMLVCKNSAYMFLSEMLFTQCSDMLAKNKLENYIKILVISPIKNETSFPSIKEAIKYVKEKELVKTIYSPTSNLNFSFFKILENIAIVKDTFSLIEYIRMIKDKSEIEKIRRACTETFLISQKIPEMAMIGISEFELAKQIDMLSIYACGEKAFDTIVSFGENTVFPHYIPNKDQILKNENKSIMVDFGTKFEGYCSDITRMFFVEESKNKRLKEIYKIVKDVQEETVGMVRAGVKVKELDLHARKMFEKFDLDRYFIHSTGHGVGLEIHELPRVNKSDDTILKTGMVITIEPGIYVNGIGGIRIEDTILVTDKGAEVLTRGD